MVIFVKAWCWIYATIFKPRNVKCNIFSELTQKASPLFFRLKISKNCWRKILCDNWKPNRTLCWNYIAWKYAVRDKPSLRDIWNPKTELCVEITLRENMLCVTNQVCVTFETRKPNFVDKRCVDFFQFVKIQHCIQQRFALMAGLAENPQWHSCLI